MNHFILPNPGSDWFYECLGPGDSVVITPSETEALFWQRLGYVVRYAIFRSS